MTHRSAVYAAQADAKYVRILCWRDPVMRVTIRTKSRSSAQDNLRVYIGALDKLHDPLDRSPFPQNWIINLRPGIVADKRFKVDVLDLILIRPQLAYPPLLNC